jgi:hypothetical protein
MREPFATKQSLVVSWQTASLNLTAGGVTPLALLQLQLVDDTAVRVEVREDAVPHIAEPLFEVLRG